MNDLQTYLDTILSKEQQHILAYCLKNDIKVNLMALKGGKTSISWLFEKAGYSLNCDLEAGTTLIICKNRETINVGSVFRRYTVEDVKIWLDKICDCQPIRKKYDKLRYISNKELKKENAELKRQLEERQKNNEWVTVSYKIKRACLHCRHEHIHCQDCKYNTAPLTKYINGIPIKHSDKLLP